VVIEAGERNVSWADRLNNSTVQNDNFVEVQHRRRSAANRGSTSSIAAPTDNKKKRSVQVVGCNINVNSVRIKSGVHIVKKRVFHVDNLHSECDDNELKQFLTSHRIETITCFKAKSWLREEDREQVAAFRMCIPESDAAKFCCPDIWPLGVRVRDWIFKRQDGGDV